MNDGATSVLKVVKGHGQREELIECLQHKKQKWWVSLINRQSKQYLNIN